MLLVPSPVRGQALPFAVQHVEWSKKSLDVIRKAYRAEASESELLYCVESWKAEPEQNAVQRITITGVRRAAAGSKHALADVDSHCLSDDGKPLPTIHTHSDGNCQFSPADLITSAARRAPFEGVQCGVRHVVWVSSWQIVAMANGLQGQRPPAITPR
jgi:hypothetical protein